MSKSCIFLFPTKSDLEITKNNRSITLTTTICFVSQSYTFWKGEISLEKSERFPRNWPIIIDFNYSSNHRKGTLNISKKHYFSNPLNSIHWEKMEQILLACSVPKETVTTIMMLYKNVKALVHSPDGFLH